MLTNKTAIFDAAPFYSSTSALRFRAIPDSLAQYHVEASECCLIHADNPLSAIKGVFVNPGVRVTYDGRAYNTMKNFDRSLNPAAIFTHLWHNRLRRWFTTDTSKNWIVTQRVRDWGADDPANQEAGTFCLLNEMQVLDADGWLHV